MTDPSENPDAFDEAELDAVAVFPLPRVVLFPGTRLPLHIFEPRYREMMADCIAQRSRCMVIAQLTGDWKRDYHGCPPIHPVAGLGRIEEHRHNQDGTYDLQLLGLLRVRLSELPLAGRGYRRARAAPLRERMPPAGLPQAELMSLYSQAAQVAALVQQREPRFTLLATPADSAPRLADKLADQFVGDPDVRQDLLETLDVAARFRQLAARLSQLQLALLAGGDGGGGERTLH
jgi:Lon protease-like protein